MEERDKDSKSRRSATQALELVAKVTAGIIGLIYLCGFIVVSMRLSEYGALSSALLRGQYLVAGVFSLGPFFLTAFFAALFEMEFKKFPFGVLPSAGWPRVWGVCRALGRSVWGLLSVYIVLGAFVAAVVSIFVPTFKGLLWTHWRTILWLMLQSGMVILMSSKTWEVALQLGTGEMQGALPKVFLLILRVGFCLILFLGYLSYFTFRVYSQIPFWAGGGKAQTIAFLLKVDSKAEVSPVSPDKATQDRSIPYKLILETDTSYIVLSENPKEKAVKVNRDAVAGFVVLE